MLLTNVLGDKHNFLSSYLQKVPLHADHPLGTHINNNKKKEFKRPGFHPVYLHVKINTSSYIEQGLPVGSV